MFACGYSCVSSNKFRQQSSIKQRQRSTRGHAAQTARFDPQPLVAARGPFG